MRLLSATALGAVAGALIWAGAADATVYAIEGQDIPPATISGTITTDGTLGALTLANIIGIDLTVSDGSNTVVLTIPYALVGSSLAATSAGLFFDYTGGATASYFIAIDTGPPATSAYCIATGPQACREHGKRGSDRRRGRSVRRRGPIGRGADRRRRRARGFDLGHAADRLRGAWRLHALSGVAAGGLQGPSDHTRVPTLTRAPL